MVVNPILEFDKRKIKKDEMIEHIEYYATRADQGMELYSSGDKKGAMQVLKELRKMLSVEYKHYSKASVAKYIDEDNYYLTYANGVSQAYVKQMNPNSYEYLHSNLYDIRDYIKHYEMGIFYKDKE